MTKYDIVIAIDPDVEKSGVAELSPQCRLLEVTNLTFPQLLDYLQTRKKMSDTAHTSLVVVVEAGWLNQSNWHLRSKDNVRVASAKGNATGRNHETGRKVCGIDILCLPDNIKMIFIFFIFNDVYFFGKPFFTIVQKSNTIFILTTCVSIK